MSTKHSHTFVDEFEGFIGFGLNRKTDEDTVQYYLQKFSDDELMSIIKTRLTQEELNNIFNTISSLIKKYLTDSEYHKIFIKEIT